MAGEEFTIGWLFSWFRASALVLFSVGYVDFELCSGWFRATGRLVVLWFLFSSLNKQVGVQA